MPTIWRSLMFVPANNPKFIAKAHTRNADGIILDLEDSVPDSELESARAGLRMAVASVARGGSDVLVRINNPDHLCMDDIQAAVIEGVTAIMLPKARNAMHVQSVSEAIGKCEHANGMTAGSIRLVPMIETAAAYFQSLEIGAADPRNIAMHLGGEDFSSDVGMIPGADTLAMPKQQVVIAARAAGLIPLGLMGTVADFQDLNGIRLAAEMSRRFGIEGASCVHPSNVPILNAAFSPNPDEIDYAERVVAIYANATAKGIGAISVDGKMIDVPVVRRAELLLARWAAIKVRHQADEERGRPN